MIQRKLSEVISSRLFSGKAILLIGARQVGKTTLLKQLISDKDKALWFNADEFSVRNLFENVSVERFRTLFGDAKIVIIDEAQRIENIGIKLKLITDQLTDIQLIATGSSAFELSNKINEPLTGRKWEYELYPLSFGEMVAHHGYFEEYKHLPVRLIYGYYPDVVNNPGSEKQILHQLTESYLYKDILEWERIKKPDKLLKLLQALAFQVGSQVSFNELSNLIEIDKITVEKYIILLEQSKVIFRLSSLSRNLRNELKMSRKIYFYDNGIRNALISNFSEMEMRTDTGALWENFMISERIKLLQYNEIWANKWFWRTSAQQEVDYIEEADGKMTAYEFKWNPAKKARITKVFSNAYPAADLKVINRDNFDQFLLFKP
jgi:predicted AAA+ superfamily ATPase